MTDPVSIHGIAELKRHVGVTLGPGDWFSIDQAQIDLFAEATGDRQWIHTDPERAAELADWLRARDPVAHPPPPTPFFNVFHFRHLSKRKSKNLQ